jgi:hypothetical protein
MPARDPSKPARDPIKKDLGATWVMTDGGEDLEEMTRVTDDGVDDGPEA